jgi:acetylornithine deacetylase
MTDAETTAKIMNAVDGVFDQVVDLTGELVKFPSRYGAEQTAQDFVAGELRGRGYDVDRWRISLDDISHLPGFSPPVRESYDDAYNVVGAHRPANPTGRSLILNGHIDVVPEGPADMWTSPPYAPRIDGGWLYGRGGGDMKAGIAAALGALDALRTLGYQPAADVYLQSVIEEECTGNGALACLQRGYRADAALIPEPVDEGVLTAQVGVIWFQVGVRGMPVHVREAGSGANAIEAAYGLMQALHGLEARWNAAKVDHAAFAHEDHPINLNVGKIVGGDWASSVPAWCTFDVRVGVYPGIDLAEACAEIEACIRDAARADPFLANSPPTVSFNGFQAEGYVLAGADAPMAALAEAHRSAFGGELEKTAMMGTTDARFFGLYADIPALVYGPRADNIHGFDERVELESLRKVTQSIALFIADWCGLEAV